MKYVVCYSGGHSSALAAVETVRKYGKENVILLNHNISSKVERPDVKRFKQEVADVLGIEITYANHPQYEQMTPLALARELKAFQYRPGEKLCTYYLKTKPFYDWLKENYPAPKGRMREDITLIYGFDNSEPARIERRIAHLRKMGYYVQFPLTWEQRTIFSIEEIGVKPPESYAYCRHGNCDGCLKAGRISWYRIFVGDGTQVPSPLFVEAMETEEIVGHSILKDTYLKELIPDVMRMYQFGIPANENVDTHTFWAFNKRRVNGEINIFSEMYLKNNESILL